MNAQKMKAVVSATGFFLYDAAPGYVVEPGTSEVPTLEGDFLRPRYADGKWQEGASADEIAAHRHGGAVAAWKAWRLRQLDAADKAINKIEDKGGDAENLRAYRVLLRDMPEKEADPLKWSRPDLPA